MSIPCLQVQASRSNLNFHPIKVPSFSSLVKFCSDTFIVCHIVLVSSASLLSPLLSGSNHLISIMCCAYKFMIFSVVLSWVGE